MSDSTTNIPYGYCHCGCGQKTAINPRTKKPNLFIHHHHQDSFLHRFWSRVNKNGGIPQHAPHLGACWEYSVSEKSHAYGKIRKDGKNLSAHRASWEIAYGEIPDGLFVCHKCDNTRCVNPNHLFLGTHIENMEDRDAKGHTSLKLTSQQIEAIIEEMESGVLSHKEIAKKIGIRAELIGKFLRGKYAKSVFVK